MTCVVWENHVLQHSDGLSFFFLWLRMEKLIINIYVIWKKAHGRLGIIARFHSRPSKCLHVLCIPSLTRACGARGWRRVSRPCPVVVPWLLAGSWVVVLLAYGGWPSVFESAKWASPAAFSLSHIPLLWVLRWEPEFSAAMQAGCRIFQLLPWFVPRGSWVNNALGKQSCSFISFLLWSIF